mmetsp:Transcript_148695/g.277124  ORF Transcript_148695/g.277124 Transcript_148695/m.277124 type:complete len:104 (+) Transcript_148695:1847-2158(+)
MPGASGLDWKGASAAEEKLFEVLATPVLALGTPLAQEIQASRHFAYHHSLAISVMSLQGPSEEVKCGRYHVIQRVESTSCGKKPWWSADSNAERPGLKSSDRT